ncbi:MAG: isopenicillin N synthase family oxygenase [Bacteroidetes bacterium]|jgi:isopenicillin N synthase-like dioxygenase|nr:isopenicillin N synthase family oxygenase [Bacteroidota bacterium]
MSIIPSLDLNLFVKGTPDEKAQFVDALGKAYEDTGFAAIKNHLLSEALETQLYEASKQFFGLPIDTKLKYADEALAGQRGYTGWGKEHAKGKNVGDLKEFWHFGQYVPDNLKSKFDYFDNITVEELEDFNSIGEQAFKALEETGKYMLRAMALYLGIDEFYFDSEIQYGNSILRPIHYPPIIEEPPVGAVRAGEHEDINLITLLMGASAGGLEVLTKDQKWVGVTSLKEHLVVNVGDMLQRLTNNKFKSTTHRVVNPPRSEWSSPRYSIPFFLHPKSSTRLDCLASCIDSNHPKQYDDISAGEYLRERLLEIGLLNNDSK